MKTLLSLFLLSLAISCKAGLTIIPISQFKNTGTLGTNYLFIVAATGTNNNISVLQLEYWLANDPNFVKFMTNNPSYQFSGGSGGGIPVITNTPSFVFTNFIATWNTNQTFQLGSFLSSSTYPSSRILIDNTSTISNIVAVLPQTMYSLSAGTNVTSATVLTNSVLDLKIVYANGTYFVEDFGANNPLIKQLANFSSSSHGIVMWTNGGFQLF